MSDYSMTQLSAKQSLLDIQIKRMKKLNYLLAEMVFNEMNIDVLNAIQDVCNEIENCASDIKIASDSIGSYAFMAKQELKEQEKVAPPVISFSETVGEAKQDG